MNSSESGRAVGYARISSVGQEGGDGLGRQTREIRDFAGSRGLCVSEVFRESESGTADFEDRPIFMKMIQFCIERDVGIIIVEGMDRLAREMRVQEALLIYLVSKNLTLLSARTGEDITEAVQSDPMRKALVQIQGVFAELEKGMLVQKLRKARTQVKIATGRCEGRKPFGYYPGEKDRLELIFELWKQGHVISQISMYLNIKGIKTRSGGKWTATTVKRIIERGEEIK